MTASTQNPEDVVDVVDVGDVVDDVVVAVDGGGSKTDAVALTLDGRIVARRRGDGCSPHFVGLPASVATIDALVRAVAGDATVVQTDLYVSGVDLPIEFDRFRAALTPFAWARHGLVVENDLFAVLRAGTDELDAIGVVCGTGINAVGVRRDGATVRFPALGGISGDWGGGYGLGSEALWHAARAVDGRGPDTALVEGICRVMGVTALSRLIEQLHFGDREASDLALAAPIVFEAAAAGDSVAIRLVDRQAQEIVAFVRAVVERLSVAALPIPIVLGGGILEAEYPQLQQSIAAGIAVVAPLARIETVRQPPIIGAALLALAHAGAGPDAMARARRQFAGDLAAAV